MNRWLFEVWNEPNFPTFWSAGQSDYFKLYRHTVEAVKQVSSSLQVGGPVTSKNGWIEDFLGFVDRNKLPADFVSTHHYPNDSFQEYGNEVEVQLAHGRRSVLREQAQDTRRRAGYDRPLYYTEWNTSTSQRDHLHDEPYAAAFIVKTMLEANGLVDGYSFWTFSDIFEESFFPSVPFHGGFGLLNLHGIPKPSFRAFQVLHELGDALLPVDGLHQTLDAWAVRKPHGLTLLVTNHALPHRPIECESVRFTLWPGPLSGAATLRRIDEEHANPKRLWESMGKPEYLNENQIDRLQAASEMRPEKLKLRRSGNDAAGSTLEFAVPAHGVAAIDIDWTTKPTGRTKRRR